MSKDRPEPQPPIPDDKTSIRFNKKHDAFMPEPNLPDPSGVPRDEAIRKMREQVEKEMGKEPWYNDKDKMGGLFATLVLGTAVLMVLILIWTLFLRWLF